MQSLVKEKKNYDSDQDKLYARTRMTKETEKRIVDSMDSQDSVQRTYMQNSILVRSFFVAHRIFVTQTSSRSKEGRGEQSRRQQQHQTPNNIIILILSNLVNSFSICAMKVIGGMLSKLLIPLLATFPTTSAFAFRCPKAAETASVSSLMATRRDFTQQLLVTSAASLSFGVSVKSAEASGGATAGGAYLLSAKQRYNARVKEAIKGLLDAQAALAEGNSKPAKAYFSSEDGGSWKDLTAAGYLLSNAFRRSSTTAPDRYSELVGWLPVFSSRDLFSLSACFVCFCNLSVFQSTCCQGRYFLGIMY